MSVALSVKNKSQLQFTSILPLFLIGLIWITYLVAYSFVQHTGWGWILPSFTNYGMFLILTISFFVLWRKAEKGSMAKLLFGVFLISRFFVFGDIIIYYGVHHWLHVARLTQFWSSIDDVFCILGTVLVSLSLLLILLSAKVDTKKSVGIYIPVVLATVILLSISFYAVKWHPADTPITVTAWSASIYAIIEKVLEIAYIIVAALCVATSKNRGIFYLALGFLIGIITDVVLTFGIFSQAYEIGSVFESGIFLGDLLVFYGLFLLYKNKRLSNVRDWIAAPDSARGQAAYWGIVLSLTSIVSAVVAAKTILPIVFNRQLPFLPTFLTVCIVFATILSNIIARKSGQPFKKLETLIDDFLHTDKTPNCSDLKNQNLYLAEFKQLREFLIQAFAAIQEKSKADKEGLLIASRLAHDISSPLATLAVLSEKTNDGFPEDARALLHNATESIRGISYGLLRRYKAGFVEDNDAEANKNQPLLVCLALMQLIAGKKYQYSNLWVNLKLHFDEGSKFTFIKTVPIEFQRMMSNLLNNAVDALEGKPGDVHVTLHSDNERLKISIQDDGKGMPKDVADKLLANIAVTQGKKNGHGLGFAQISETIKNSQGEISIDSKVGYGTTITLTFPKTAPASWLATSLELQKGDTVIVLDDDTSIHGAWEERFKSCGNAVCLKHFQSGLEALEFINNVNEKDKSRMFLLADYELLKQNLNGIDVIENSSLPKNRSVLVTSHYGKKDVLDYSAKTGIKILPKQLAAEVSIKVL